MRAAVPSQIQNDSQGAALHWLRIEKAAESGHIWAEIYQSYTEWRPTQES